MKQFLIQAGMSVLLLFGMIGCLNIHAVSPQSIAEIYMDLHGGAR